MTRAERLIGALLGQALGDALGFVVEAAPPEAAAAYVRETLAAGRAGERSHPSYAFGQYTDDTQLARELLISIRAAGGWSPPAFAERLAALFEGGGDVGAGPGTRAAAARLLAGASWLDAGSPRPYAGNGGAMRAAPLGVLFAGEPDLLRRAVREQTWTTHRDPRCAAGAVAVAGAVSLGMAPGPLDPHAVLATVAAWAGREDESVALAVAGVADWLDAAPDDAARRLHAAGLEPEGSGEWRGISAFVTSSVAWSLYAFLRTPDDYWTTVCTAIAIGGDTDTMAAMAGAMSGARLGPGALPGKLLSRLTDRGRWNAAELRELALDCADLFPDTAARDAPSSQPQSHGATLPGRA